MATKRSGKRWYMHTLNGQPAAFDPNHGGYIHFIGRRLSRSPLVADLATIRRQQAKAKADDARMGVTYRLDPGAPPMSAWSIDEYAALLVVIAAVAVIWEAPIFKPWFGFRKPKGHPGRWFQ